MELLCRRLAPQGSGVNTGPFRVAREHWRGPTGQQEETLAMNVDMDKLHEFLGKVFPHKGKADVLIDQAR
jgi:hypothetical protein